MISKELEIKVRQHFFRDGWPVGTIASQLGLHPDAIKRVIALKPSESSRRRDNQIAAYRDFIVATLEAYPNLRSTRLLEMVKHRGYRGSVYPIRRLRRKLQPPHRTAYLDLKFTPGEQAQMDWASFGKMDYGGSQRPLQAFVMVLSYSRRIFARFYHDMKSARVLEGHCEAFQYWGGVPRVVVYDNMRTAVVENLGSAIRFQEDLMGLAAHFHFEPRACNPRAGWEKGRTERAIRYLRESFFAGRDFVSLEDLNQKLEIWLHEISDCRGWPDNREITVIEAFGEENLSPLPENDYEVYEERRVRVDKKSYVSFDANKYPVDPEWVGGYLTLRACHREIRLFHNHELVSLQERHWGRGVTIFSADHQQKIADSRKIRTQRRDRHVLARSMPSGEQLLKSWAELGENLASNAREVIGFINIYGVDKVEAAACHALTNGTPCSGSVGYILAQEQGEPLPPKPPLKLREDLANIEVEQHSMSDYDDLYNP